MKKTNDYYYWHEGTIALFEFDGPGSSGTGARWRRWNPAMKRALVSNQHKEGCQAGSWDSDDRWGFEGGRVYAAALNALTLETYYRYPHLMGGLGEKTLDPGSEED